ncbi:MAG: hypothetical protein DMD81_04330 [Candidatus Rokuibacteriota bacterium]|nr:MAG: hypothetical protein DMD81_04330 [Candidatus Rokubacteria bacterium]
MSRIVGTGVAIVVLGAAASLVTPARAEEVKVPVSATLILNVLSQPREMRDAAFDQFLRDPGPPAPRSSLSQVVVTVRNPCPPGTAHYEPPPLPGRRK